MYLALLRYLASFNVTLFRFVLKRVVHFDSGLLRDVTIHLHNNAWECEEMSLIPNLHASVGVLILSQ